MILSLDKSGKRWDGERLEYLRGRKWLHPEPVEGLRYLQVEMTNQCNLQCVECPQRLMVRPRQYMDMATFERVLDLLERARFEAIIPHKDGESLLHPHIQDAITLMSHVQPEVKFVIYTNGTHFSKAFYDFARRLPNKFQVLVSYHFQGFRTRRPDCEEIVQYDCEPAEAELRQCIADPAGNVELVLVSHVTPYSDAEQQNAWQARWAQVAANRPEVLSAVHLNRDINPWAGHIDIGTTTFQVCPYDTGEHLFVGVTGNILPCCMDLNEELTIADLAQYDMEEIMELRRRFYYDVQRPKSRRPRCIACIGGA